MANPTYGSLTLKIKGNPVYTIAAIDQTAGALRRPKRTARLHKLQRWTMRLVTSNGVDLLLTYNLAMAPMID
ncbi:MAG: hypothetical protein KDC35_05515 [Acidobacteria bacterium]|nr:hypothetical protein [Acidobacteriota bacterium]